MTSYADIIILIAWVICAVGFIRNLWVFNQRIYVLKKYGHYRWEKLPSYKIMMLKLWIWDIRKFIK